MIKSEDLRLGQPRILETDNNLILPVNKWIRLLVTGVNVGVSSSFLMWYHCNRFYVYQLKLTNKF